MLKYERLQDWVISEIAAGGFSVGDKLPSCRDMARMFDVSYMTVIAAMRGLEERGYVRRVGGSGVYVSKPSAMDGNPSVAGAAAAVGALMPLTGDLYQNFAESLVDALEARGRQLVSLPTKGIFGVNDNKRRGRIIRGFAARGLDALVVEGTRHVPFSLLAKHREDFKLMTFVIHFESALDFPRANSVVCDYRRVGELAAERLFESGSARIAMITFESLPELERRLNAAAPLSYDSLVIDGIESTFNSKGLDFAENFTLIVDESESPAGGSTVSKVLAAMRKGVDGFFCLGDHRARSVYQAADEAGAMIGRDIHVLGMFDTKWASVFNPTLPSISVNEREIAEIAAELSVSGKTGERVVVKPSICGNR